MLVNIPACWPPARLQEAQIQKGRNAVLWKMETCISTPEAHRKKGIKITE